MKVAVMAIWLPDLSVWPPLCLSVQHVDQHLVDLRGQRADPLIFPAVHGATDAEIALDPVAPVWFFARYASRSASRAASCASIDSTISAYVSGSRLSIAESDTG